jgi:hypothetical protein
MQLEFKCALTWKKPERIALKVMPALFFDGQAFDLPGSQ